MIWVCRNYALVLGYVGMHSATYFCFSAGRLLKRRYRYGHTCIKDSGRRLSPHRALISSEIGLHNSLIHVHFPSQELSIIQPQRCRTVLSVMGDSD